jgi:hypothetical protein
MVNTYRATVDVPARFRKSKRRGSKPRAALDRTISFSTSKGQKNT